MVAAQYESAGKRRDGAISRKLYAAELRARGKKGGVIGCAMANRANRIAYAMVRDQATYDARYWPTNPEED